MKSESVLTIEGNTCLFTVSNVNFSNGMAIGTRKYFQKNCISCLQNNKYAFSFYLFNDGTPTNYSLINVGVLLQLKLKSRVTLSLTYFRCPQYLHISGFIILHKG